MPTNALNAFFGGTMEGCLHRAAVVLRFVVAVTALHAIAQGAPQVHARDRETLTLIAQPQSGYSIAENYAYSRLLIAALSQAIKKAAQENCEIRIETPWSYALQARLSAESDDAFTSCYLRMSNRISDELLASRESEHINRSARNGNLAIEQERSRDPANSGRTISFLVAGEAATYVLPSLYAESSLAAFMVAPQRLAFARLAHNSFMEWQRSVLQNKAIIATLSNKRREALMQAAIRFMDGTGARTFLWSMRNYYGLSFVQSQTVSVLDADADMDGGVAIPLQFRYGDKHFYGDEQLPLDMWQAPNANEVCRWLEDAASAILRARGATKCAHTSLPGIDPWVFLFLRNRDGAAQGAEHCYALHLLARELILQIQHAPDIMEATRPESIKLLEYRRDCRQ